MSVDYNVGTEQEQRQAKAIEDLIGVYLKKSEFDKKMYRTTIGTKTALGLLRTIKRVIEEN